MFPVKQDAAVYIYALAFVAIGGALLILADAFGEGAFSEVTKLVTLAGTVFLAGGLLQRTVKTVENKTDGQTATIERIDATLNGKLDQRFADINARITGLEAMLIDREPRLVVMESRLDEIVEILTAPK